MNPMNRRDLLRSLSCGFGYSALAGLTTGSALAATGYTNPLALKAPHFPAKVKRVIFMYMAGAPSQLDLFDHKPKLTELEGKSIPPSVIAGQRYAFIQPNQWSGLLR